MELEIILEDYIKKPNTDFAILIDGEWGSGKTYFIKNGFQKLLDSINKENNKDNQYELTYVSLYGVNDIPDVEKKLFIAINPKLQTKAGRTGLLVLDKGLQKFGLDNVHKELINIYGGISKRRILVFDDLERLEERVLNQVMGFINNYAEHQNLKIIILAHEENLEEKLQDSYKKIKEKLIRFTYKFKSNIEVVYDTLIGEYSEEYKHFLVAHKCFILSRFNSGEHLNLRTLRFVIDVFYDIYKIVAKLKVDDEENRGQILQYYLLFICTYSIEYKKGTYDRTELIAIADRAKLNYNSNYYKMLFNNGNHKDDDTKEKSYADIFEEKYLKEDFEKYKYFDFIEKFIHTGYLNKNELKESMKVEEEKLVQEKGERHYTIYKHLIDFELYEDEELKSMVKEVVAFAKNGMYSSYDQYIELYVRLYRIANVDIIPTDDLNRIVEDLKTGICIRAKSIPHMNYIKNNVFSRALHIPGVDVLVEKIELENHANLFKENQDIANVIIEKLQSGDFEGFYDVAYENHKNQPLFVLPFFDPKKFLEIYLSKNNHDKNAILSGLTRRLYKFNNNGSLTFEEERDFFEKLLEFIDKELGNESFGKVSKYNLQQFKHVVERAISKD